MQHYVRWSLKHLNKDMEGLCLSITKHKKKKRQQVTNKFGEIILHQLLPMMNHFLEGII